MSTEDRESADAQAAESATEDLVLTDEQAEGAAGGKLIDKSSPVIYNPPPTPPPTH